MAFILEFTDNALNDLDYFKKYEQTLILDAIERQLIYQPNVETRNRKPMEPNQLATWELRIGSYRVFYDSDLQESIVKIKAVGWKEHNQLYIRGKEYIL